MATLQPIAGAILRLRGTPARIIRGPNFNYKKKTIKLIHISTEICRDVQLKKNGNWCMPFGKIVLREKLK